VVASIRVFLAFAALAVAAVLVTVIVAGPAPAPAHPTSDTARPRHLPGTDGGPAQRGCKPVISGRYYVGATRVSCRKARKVAARSIRGAYLSAWSCTGVGTGFGHCHRSGGRIVHWAVND
jgi:hypothetical protein